MKIIELTGTTDALGALTITSADNVQGFVQKVVMDYTDGDAIADLTLTNEGPTSESILVKADLGTADAVWYPRAIPNKVADGSAFTDAPIPIFVTGTFKAVIAGSTVAISGIDGDATTITVNTSANHNLSVGDKVTIAGTVGYNGTFTVATITDADTFTIASTSHDLDAEAIGTMIRGEAVYRFLVYVTDAEA